MSLCLQHDNIDTSVKYHSELYCSLGKQRREDGRGGTKFNNHILGNWNSAKCNHRHCRGNDSEFTIESESYWGAALTA